MSFHPELLVNHLVKEFLPDVKIIRLTFQKEIGKNKRQKETEIKYVEIIDKYDNEEMDIVTDYKTCIVNMVYKYLFEKSQVSIKGLKLLEQLIRNEKCVLENVGKRKVYFIDMKVEEHNKVQWVENDELPNYSKLVVIGNIISGTSFVTEITDQDFHNWIRKFRDGCIVSNNDVEFKEFMFN